MHTLSSFSALAILFYTTSFIGSIEASAQPAATTTATSACFTYTGVPVTGNDDDLSDVAPYTGSGVSSRGVAGRVLYEERGLNLSSDTDNATHSFEKRKDKKLSESRKWASANGARIMK